MQIENFSLNYLIDIEDLSVRAVNVCRNQDLSSIVEIINYYKEKGTFLDIRNCGQNTEKELLALVAKYTNIEDGTHDNQIIKQPVNVLSKVAELTPFQKSILNKHVDYLVSNLSIRSYNGLHAAISGKLLAFDFLEIIFSDGFSFIKLKNIGKTSVEELNGLKIEIINFIDRLKVIPPELLSQEYAKTVLYSKIEDFDKIIDSEANNVFEQNNKILLFKLISLLIKNNQLLNNNERTIFFNSYHSSNHLKSLEQISKDLGLTRERARQIKASLNAKLENSLSFISNFSFDDINHYGVNISDDFYIFDESVLSKINHLENVEFNRQFFAIVFQIYLKNSHAVISNSNGNGEKNGLLNNIYIVSHSIFKIFNFSQFLVDINSKYFERTSETYELHYKGYLANFLKESDITQLDRIAEICEQILFNEFELFVNEYGYLVFERNTKQHLYQYCYNILKENGNPMTLEAISKIVIDQYPEISPKIESLRSTFNRERELFICFGRTSTYGLKEWESEKENLRGGTIRDIVFDFLNENESPFHISEIWKHVENFRGTTYARSILDNLKADESKRFQFFSGNFIGLNNRKYDLTNLNLKRLIGSQFTMKVLNKYQGWSIEDVVQEYVNKFDYQPVQIEWVLKNKIENGEIKLMTDNKLFFYE